MIRRTVDGKIASARASAEPIQWEARDEWGEQVKEISDWGLRLYAIDAATAAEYFAALLVERGELEDSTVIEVRAWPECRQWIRVEVHVELTFYLDGEWEAEISAGHVVDTAAMIKALRANAKREAAAKRKRRTAA